MKPVLLNRIGFISLMAAVIVAPIFFGAVHTWAYTGCFLLVLTGGSFIALSQVSKDSQSGKPAVSVPLIAATLVIPAVAVFHIFQMIPLPVPLVKAIQPSSFHMGLMSHIPGNPEPYSLSFAPYRFPVRQSLVRWLVYGTLYWGLVQSLCTRKRIEQAIWCILGIAAIESLYGMYETFSGNHRILWCSPSANAGHMSGTYINRNHFAGLMEMTLPLAFCAGVVFRVGRLDPEAKIRIRNSWIRRLFPFISGRHGGEKRILLLMLGTIIGMGLVGSASRGGVIGALVGLGVVGGLLLRSEDTRKKGLVILSVLAVLGILSIRVDVTTLIKRFETLQSSIEVRYRYTQQTMKLIEAFPVIGVGLGNFRHAYPRYQALEDKDFFIDYAHNDWVQLTAEAGWGGAVFIACCMVALTAELVLRWRKRSRSWALGLGASGLAAIFAVAVHSWSDFNLHIPANAMMLAAVLAVSHAALVLERRREGYEMTYSVWRGGLYGKGGLALMAFLAVIGWAGVWTVRHAIAESMCPTVPNTTLRKPPAVDVSNGIHALNWDHWNADIWFKTGLALASLQRVEDKAIDDIMQSMERSVRRDEWMKTFPFVEILKTTDGFKKRQVLNHAAIHAWNQAIGLNPFDAHISITLGWAYCQYPDDPMFQGKWPEFSELCMKRAAYMAPMDPYIQESLGNYWIMRSARIDPKSVAYPILLNKGLLHYRTVFNLHPKGQHKKLRDRMIQTATRYGHPFESLIKIGKLGE